MHVKLKMVSEVMAGLFSLESEWTSFTRVALESGLTLQPTTNEKWSIRFYMV